MGGGGNTQHNADTIGTAQLRAFIERVERIEADIAERNADKSEVYKEMRGSGFDVKTVRKIVAKRKLDTADREEQDAIFDLYWTALYGGNESPSRVHVHEGQKLDPAPVPARNPSAAHGADESAAPVHPDPLSQGSTAGELTPSLDDAGAKSDGPSSIVGQGGAQPDIRNGQSGHQDGSAAQDRNEPISASGPAATLPKPLNPNCLKAKRGEPCGLAYSMASCSACANAAFKDHGRTA